MGYINSMVIMRIIVILLIIISLFGCVSYDPRYMESKTTGERLIDVVILIGFGAIIGTSIYEEVR